MTGLIDISVPLRAGLPRWPGSIGYARHEFPSADGVVNSAIVFDPHVGTHVDAPRHHIDDGADVAGLDATAGLGPVVVLDCGDVEVIDASFLEERLARTTVERLLFRTRNGRFYPEEQDFRADFTALDESGATWLAESGVRLVGIDYLSIQRYDADAEVHRILLRRGITILECLDLRHAPEGSYELIALPTLVLHGEAAPVRAVLRVLPSSPPS